MDTIEGIKAILFDFDGTLCQYRPLGGELFTDHVISLGLPITGEDRHRAAIWEHYYFANSPEIKADKEKFDGQDEDFWHFFAHRRLAALGCPSPLVSEYGHKVSEYMRESYEPDILVPEEIFTTLPKLLALGKKLGVVSNRDKPYQDEIEGLGMRNYFDFSLAAGEVNSWKPEPGIFEHAVKMAGTKPEQTLYIGDNYFADVIGARRAGLQPVLYDPNRLFREPDCPVIESFDDLLGMVERV